MSVTLLGAEGSSIAEEHYSPLSNASSPLSGSPHEEAGRRSVNASVEAIEGVRASLEGRLQSPRASMEGQRRSTPDDAQVEGAARRPIRIIQQQQGLCTRLCRRFCVIL